MSRKVSSPLGGWLYLIVVGYALYRFGEGTHWNWIGIGVCVSVAAVFVGALVWLCVDALRNKE